MGSPSGANIARKLARDSTFGGIDAKKNNGHGGRMLAEVDKGVEQNMPRKIGAVFQRMEQQLDAVASSSQDDGRVGKEIQEFKLSAVKQSHILTLCGCCLLLLLFLLVFGFDLDLNPPLPKYITNMFNIS